MSLTSGLLSKLRTSNMSAQLNVIASSIDPIQSQAESLVIADTASLAVVSELRSKVKMLLKALVADKKELTTPIKESLKAIEARYDAPETALESLIEVIDKKMIRYQTDLVNAQRKAAEAISSRVGDGKGYLRAETAVAKIEALGTVDKSVSTDSGSTSFVATPVFEVVDIFLLPIHLHLPDLVQIRKDMLAGMQHSGVEYRVEQRPRNSRT